MRKITTVILLFCFFGVQKTMAQTDLQIDNSKEKINFGFFDGTIVTGYVDQGGFLNFTGPNVSYTSGKSKILVGMLPSLRFKEDKSAVKNAFVTPTLGMGMTYSYKKIAIQVPFYYNAKTATLDGKWNVGIGIGLKLK